MDNLANDDYFYGAGSSAFRDLNTSTNVPTGPLKFVGNADSAKVSMQVERKEKRESRTGTNGLVRSKVVFLGGTVEITINEKHKENLELFLFGDTVSRVAVVAHEDAEKIPALHVVGEVYPLEYQQVTDVVITDDGAADAVVADTKYEVDEVYGKIKVLADLGTGPFTMTYDAAAVNIIPVFQHSDKPVLWRHEGINIGNDEDEPFLIEFYKVKLDPVTDLELITNDFGQFVIKGTLLASPWKQADPNFGKFGRHVDLVP